MMNALDSFKLHIFFSISISYIKNIFLFFLLKGFNKEIEEMQRVQRGYSIPDLELRESIKRDNKEQILPKYQAFYDK